MSDTTYKYSGRIYKKIFCIAAAFLLVSILAACGCSIFTDTPSAPQALNGVIDLRKWDFKNDGTIKLKGQWEFYWGQLLEPADFTRSGKSVPTLYAKVPGAWNSIKTEGGKLPLKGYATYRLKILLKEPADKLGFYHASIYSAFKLFVNGDEIASAGAIGKNEKQGTPSYRPEVIGYSSDAKELDVIIQVSNYHAPDSGLIESLTLGTQVRQNIVFGRKIFYEFFLFGSLLAIGLYYLILYFYRRKDNAHGFFGILCISISILFLLSLGQAYVLVLFFPDFGWVFRFLLATLLIYLSIPSLGSFFVNTFPMEFSKKAVNILWLISAAFAVLALTTHSTFYGRATKVYEIIITAYFIYFLICVILALKHSRKGSLVMFAGFLSMFIATISDILGLNNIWVFSYELFLTPFAMFFFICCIALMLAARLTGALNAEERLSSELYAKNIELDGDIAKRISTEKELVETKNYLGNVINSLSALIIPIDENCMITQLNASAERFMNIKAAGAIGKPVWDVLPFLGQHRDSVEQVITGGGVVTIEKQSVSEDDHRYLSVIVTPLDHGGPRGAVILAEDITELEIKEQQLRHAQKMETIGTLAGGLAHDFNNVLSGIVSPISLMQHMLDEKDELEKEFLKRQLSIMNDSANRAADMIRQLLAVSRRRELEFVSMDINKSVENVINICRQSFDKNIEINVRYYPSKPFVFADQTQIEQVLLNLCINASHAMTIMKNADEPQGGTLFVHIDRIHADSIFASGHPEATKDEYWKISVQDTGVGIPREARLKIFDPFFSTKDVDKGTGLGLAMVYSIVKQHKGFITVYSEPGKGSLFNVFLPVSNGKEHAQIFIPESLKRFDKALVLVADDEAFIRETLEAMLKELGLDVITAANGEMALDIFRLKSSEINVVILDMVMPKMSGREAFIEMMKINSSVPVIISSGFSWDERVEAMINLGAKTFIHKPYTLGKLWEALNTVLGNKKENKAEDNQV
jgi:PAS domain S-box-containing protein